MGNKSKGNVLIKIISVLVAIILWFYIQTVQNPYIDFTFNALSVSLHNAHLLEERNLVVTGETDFKTDVTVNCARMSLGKLKKDDFVVYADLSEVKSAGVVELPIGVRINNENILVSNKEPSTIKLTVDTIVTVEKDILVHTVGKVKKESYTNDDMITAESDRVMIRGPKSLLTKVANGIATVDLSGKSESFSDLYDIVLVDENGTAVIDEKITLLNENVKVSVEILPTKMLPIEISNISEDVKYSLTPSRVEVAGPKEILDTMDKIVVDNFNLISKTEGHTQNVSITLPEELMLITDVIPELKVLVN